MAKILSEVLTGKRHLPQPMDATVWQLPVTVVMPAVAPVANDLIQLIDLPAGVSLVDFDVIAPQLDSNGTPTAAYSLGSENAGGTDLGVVYEAGLTAGRTANGSVSRATTAAQFAADATVARRITLKVTTGYATYAGSGKTLLVILHLRG